MAIKQGQMPGCLHQHHRFLVTSTPTKQPPFSVEFQRSTHPSAGTLSSWLKFKFRPSRFRMGYSVSSEPEGPGMSSLGSHTPVWSQECADSGWRWRWSGRCSSLRIGGCSSPGCWTASYSAAVKSKGDSLAFDPDSVSERMKAEMSVYPSPRLSIYAHSGI